MSLLTHTQQESVQINADVKEFSVACGAHEHGKIHSVTPLKRDRHHLSTQPEPARLLGWLCLFSEKLCNINITVPIIFIDVSMAAAGTWLCSMNQNLSFKKELWVSEGFPRIHTLTQLYLEVRQKKKNKTAMVNLQRLHLSALSVYSKAQSVIQTWAKHHQNETILWS